MRILGCVPFVAICFAAALVGQEPNVAALRVTTDFPGGAADISRVDATQGEIDLSPPVAEGRGWPCWWYVRIDGLTPGQKLSVKVSAAKQPYREGALLAGDWSLPERAAISEDDAVWTQTPPGKRLDRNSALYQFEAPAETIWLAWGPPCLPSHAEELLACAQKRLPQAERFVLAKTLEGRDVTGIRFGGGSPEAPAKYGIWVQARQHAWESGSSWVGAGFLEWATSDDPAAAELRRVATIHFVPIMDVDSVAGGLGGKEATPRDHNRDWIDMPRYPEVAAAQRKIVELNEAGKLDLYLDLHNPGASNKKPYFYGPHDLDSLSNIEQRNYADWIAVAAGAISGPLPLQPRYEIASYIKTDEERRRMSSNWVRDRAAPHVISTTLETAWNTPHSTQEGYRTVGRQLGEALAKYLALDPRRE
ncbi:MAG TPA: M14 family zinc carboxypeptidase [Pirellulaceae bacterium]|jgi:hypothetical protein|nr:M14 family zinc carboxypeptidase [Pirellulaceae bacterium]